MSLDILDLEKELRKRCQYPYSWGRKQSNDWDYATNFIYNTQSFLELQSKTESFSEDLKNYAYNRWLNFWSAKGVEQIFCEDKRVVANTNQYDKLVDFTIDNIPFDHKTSVFPKKFNKSIDYAQKNRRELIEWLYINQSQEGRKHLKNRLFVVLYDSNACHWKLKAEMSLLKTEINKYLATFSIESLEKLNFTQEVYSDIIWVKN